MQSNPTRMSLLARVSRRLASLDVHTTRFMAALFRRHRRLVVLAFLGNLFAALFEGVTMAIFAIALDVLPSDDASALDSHGPVGRIGAELRAQLGQEGLFVLLVVLAVLSQVARSMLRFGADAAAASLQANIEGDARRSLARQFMRVRYADIRRYKTGDLATYSEQVNLLGLTIQRINNILGQVLLLVVYLALLLWLSWPATLLAAAAMVLASVSLRRIVRRVRRAGRGFRTSIIHINERIVEFLHGLRLVHTFAREDYAIGRIDEAIQSAVETRRKGLLWQATLTPLIDAIAVIGVGGFLIAGLYIVRSSDQAAFARLAAFLVVLYRLVPRLSVINKQWGLLNGYLPFAERIAWFLREDDKEYLVDGTRPFRQLAEGIRFERVTLIYAGDQRPAVTDVSLDIRRGQMIALVGESGAGKSTLIDLLLRLYDPVDGRILVDGVDLRELLWNDWRDRIGVVSQQTFLLHDTVRNNIAFGRLDATPDEIERAARAAHAHEFICKLENGYDTVVGDEGYKLSGGQRQRLAIARAILRDPDILILDEATSDLDSQSEQLIQDSLLTLRKNRTVIAVAHRLSTIAAADQIVVLNAGRIVESGRHADLLARNGTYAHLASFQAVAPTSE